MFLLQVQNPINEEELIHKADSAKAAFQQFTEMLAADPGTALQNLGRQAIQFGLKVLAAIVIYIIGAWLIKRIKKGLQRLFERKQTDRAMASFISSFVSIALTIVLIIVTIGTLGVNTTSLAALLAAGGMAIGMALSGTLQNFAGGLMIMAFKPFKAGDYIEALGYAGTVTEVTIVGTHLTTFDNRKVILPNGALSGGNVVNYSYYPLRRIDITVGVEYGTDAAACKQKLTEIVLEDPRFLSASTPGAKDPIIAIQKLDSSSVNFLIRAWVRTEDYWGAWFDLNERVYTELPQAGINFPFPQVDVHVRS
ncbi:MAG: mechanosensitive ion channel [Bacteroidales bacterium]|nr:mechanosensitive ion channel [Bacteroidales bacterium]